MKTPLVFIAGAATGALAMWLAYPKADPVAQSPSAQTNTGKPVRAAHEDAKGTMGKTKTERTAKAEDDDETIVLDEDDEDSPEMAAIRETMTKELLARKQRRIDERLAAMKTRLNLDEAQAAKVRVLLEAGDEEDDMVSKAIAGESTLPLAPGEAVKKRTELEDQISSLLKPEQANAFTEFRQEQRENRIEVATGREMTRLQQSLTLSPTQKDQVYQALATIASTEEEGGNAGITIDPEQIKARRQARLEALKPILTPEQYSTYERSSGSLINHEGSVITIEEAPAE
jgi:hypothetical protein